MYEQSDYRYCLTDLIGEPKSNTRSQIRNVTFLMKQNFEICICNNLGPILIELFLNF